MALWVNGWACCSVQGGLQCWDSKQTSNKPQHFSSSMLCSTPTCLAMCSSCHHYHQTGSKHKRKQLSDETTQELIAVGCADGGIRICSPSVAKLVSCMMQKDDTASMVTSVAWLSQTSGLVAGHENGYVILWNLEKNVVMWKLKADKAAISSVAISPKDEFLLTGSTVIKCWNMETQECLKKFSGHASGVRHLQFIPHSSHYFISFDALDRIVTAWHLDLKDTATKVMRSVVSFACNEVPVHATLSGSRKQKHNETVEPVQMSVCTKSGEIHVFKALMNGHTSKPIQPMFSCSVKSTATTASALSILCSQFETGSDCDHSNSGLKIMYGSFERPMFELLKVVESQTPTVLVRKDPLKVPVTHSQSFDKTHVPVINQDVSYLTPEHLLPSTSNDFPPTAEKLRKTETQLSMEDRLKVMAVREAGGGSSEVSSDAMAILLTQGLHSGDSKIVQQVLGHTNDQLVQETVKQLPVLSVIPLIREIAKIMAKNTDLFPCLKWFQAVLSNHLSFLSSHPEIMALLNSQHEMMTARLNLMDKVLRLEGRLNLLVEQAQSKSSKCKVAGQEPKLIFDEDSSEDELEAMSAISVMSQPWDELDQMSDVSDDEAAIDDRTEEEKMVEVEEVAGEGSSGEESEDVSVDGRNIAKDERMRIGESDDDEEEEEDDQSEEISGEDDDQSDDQEEGEFEMEGVRDTNNSDFKGIIKRRALKRNSNDNSLEMG